MDMPSVSIRDQGERLAFLSETASLASLAETLISLANSAGGTLLIGVNPRSGAPQGLADPGLALDRVLQAALATEPPLIMPMPYAADTGGQEVLVATVPPGLPHVYSYRGKYLIRSGTRNRPLIPSQLRHLMLERGGSSFELLVPEGATIRDLEWDAVDRYLAGMGRLPSAGRDEALIRRGCLAQSRDVLSPTYAGLLLFGHDPQRWVPSSEVLVARYPGTTMGDQFIKEQVRGTLPEQLRRAEAFVVGNMRRGVRILGLERVEEPEYPVEAVREAIVNAVAHRDYQIRGDEIRILLFRDRIEFYSPGRLPGHVTVANLVDERFSRNGAIVQVLSDMGYIERLGYGIDRMVRAMADAGLPLPRFEETAAGFRVTLVGRDLGYADELPGAGRWRHMGLSERQSVALAFLAEKGRITNRELQELCPDVSPETIRRDLSDMVRKSLLLKIGDKRGTYYILK